MSARFCGFLQRMGLAEVYCPVVTPPAITYNKDVWKAFDTNASGRKIYVPNAYVETYKMAEGWSDYADAIVGYDFSE